jgi:hypothetical protein
MAKYNIRIDEILSCVNSIQIYQGGTILCKQDKTSVRIVEDNNKYILIDIYKGK